MSELIAQHCEPCEGGVAPLTRDEAQALMTELHEDWSLTEDATNIGFADPLTHADLDFLPL